MVPSHRLLWWMRPGLPLDPRTLWPSFVRDEGNTDAFLKHLVEVYGGCPREVITDEGCSLWQVEGVIARRVVHGKIGD